VLVASTGVTTTVSLVRPVHYAVLPSLAATPGALVRANSVSGVFDGIGLFVGPVVAGVLTQHVGAWSAVALSAAAMAAAAVLCLGLRLPAASGGDDEGAVHEALEGLRTVRRDRPVLALLTLVGLAFVVTGSLDILCASYSDVVLGTGNGAAGLLVGCDGLGGLLGAAAAAGLATRARLASPITLTLVFTGLPLMGVATVQSLGPAVGLLVLSGVGIGAAQVGARTLLQRGTDDRVLARVFAVQEGVMLLGLAVGAVVAPLLIHGFGSGAAFAVLGAGLLVLALVALGPMRALDRRAVLRPDVVAALRGVAFLGAMSLPALERLSHAAEWIDVPADRAVVVQGDPGDAFYVVGSGSLSVDVDGVRRPHTLVAGQGFGEIALLHDLRRTATVTALEPCRLLRVEREDFLAAVTGSPDGATVAHEVAAAHLERDAAA
jgi:predicted MFS family arabinose efflux permease